MKKTVFSLAAAVTMTGAFATSASAAEYTINKGDTLWSIAQDNQVSVDKLKKWNDLDSNLIYPNQKLTVTKEAKEQASEDTYTVKSGDTLYKISQQFGITVDQLMAWNNLSSTMIYPGDKFAVKAQAAQSHSNNNHASASKSNQSSDKKAKAEKTNVKDTSTQKNNTSNDVIKEFTASATAYTANCAGCSGVTATGIDLKANPNQKVIAVDPDVIPLGSKVYVEGYGIAIAGDTGGDINGKRIDVFIPNKQDAMAFGSKNVKVQVLSE
ncbi:LysM peptidoglycan-binding domain-containing protein [Halobacillus salinarum]|uniref:LysM peptidoglycan-binding domain-containing protein n=1 Tax=Halobacillus salinarum TaxID=2932257 RepID=A0ABY4EEB1_9BACI|nr:LysM peptidoglycan-binding and 3D domain-containing protein [Halobacillus salinarum]UOQ42803.1 LysM peptidoglycan-binding domain-containing protein [Halobacillus salinarum]